MQQRNHHYSHQHDQPSSLPLPSPTLFPGAAQCAPSSGALHLQAEGTSLVVFILPLTAGGVALDTNAMNC